MCPRKSASISFIFGASRSWIVGATKDDERRVAGASHTISTTSSRDQCGL